MGSSVTRVGDAGASGMSSYIRLYNGTMKQRFMVAWLIPLLWVLPSGFPGRPLAAAASSEPLLVFAASSLTNVFDELGAAWTKQSGQPVRFSYAASAVLARQLEAGAPADLFASADAGWMDYAQQHQLLDAATRSDLLGNRLVLVAPADSRLQLHIAAGFGLAAALHGGRLAIGDPQSVPAGKYAQQALTSLRVWQEVEGQVVRADNVRSALAFVDRGESPLGIVYETDAQQDQGVRVVDVFPAGSHPPIVYPVALTRGAHPGAASLLAFLHSDAAQAVFHRYGFTPLH
jgi:molybdate transport system substrate-binding protein